LGRRLHVIVLREDEMAVSIAGSHEVLGAGWETCCHGRDARQEGKKVLFHRVNALNTSSPGPPLPHGRSNTFSPRLTPEKQPEKTDYMTVLAPQQSGNSE